MVIINKLVKIPFPRGKVSHKIADKLNIQSEVYASLSEINASLSEMQFHCMSLETVF